MPKKRQDSENVEFEDIEDDVDIERVLAEANELDKVLKSIYADEVAADRGDGRARKTRKKVSKYMRGVAESMAASIGSER